MIKNKNSWGGYYADQKGGQALILRACPPGGSPKGGLRQGKEVTPYGK